MLTRSDSVPAGAFVSPDTAPTHPGGSGSRPGTTWYTAAKAVIDFVLALLLLILTLPLIVLAALAVKLTSRGPAFYSQTRLGQGGRPYRIYKVRTMTHNCESKTGARWATPDDPRITRVGRLLRRTHIDELPQLWNVLRGEMSLVGPRPERPEFVPRLEQAVPRYRERLRVRPGLTGLAQVQLPPDSDLDSVRRKLAHDLHYVEHAGPWLDLRILASTVFHVLGLPAGVGRVLLVLPGGKPVEQAYMRSLAAGAVGDSSPNAALVVELQPA
jgi:lipopolysaccharide/colanic/teichoic acid biosynthesis glycosyltransferase